jgi:predicted Na+-dependent transporter
MTATFKSMCWMRRRVVCLLTALCFTWLASLAATHLHLSPEADEACAVCAAVVGKVAGPAATPAINLGLETNNWLPIGPRQYSPLVALAVVLPPSCGPPDYS